MIPAPLFQSSADAWRIWAQFGSRYLEMMFASAQVITHRTGRMRIAGTSPGAADRQEFSLMKQEKVDAVFDSAQAMVLESAFAAQRYAAFTLGQFFGAMPALFSLALPGTTRQVSDRRIRLVRSTLQRSAVLANKLSAETGKIVHKGLTPIRKRVTANAKRLKRVR